MVELVYISRFDGGGHHSGVDSDFPCSRVAQVVGDTWVRARLQDVADAVIVHEQHGHAPWRTRESLPKSGFTHINGSLFIQSRFHFYFQWFTCLAITFSTVASICRKQQHMAKQHLLSCQARRWPQHSKRLIRPLYHFCPLPLAVLDLDLYDLLPSTQTVCRWFGGHQKCRVSLLRSKKETTPPPTHTKLLKGWRSGGGQGGTSECVPDCLTHVGCFDLQLGWSSVVVGKRQRALFNSVQQLGDGMFPTLLFHSVPGHQLILLHQVVYGVH